MSLKLSFTGKFRQKVMRSNQGQIENIESASSIAVEFPIDVTFSRRHNQNNRRKKGVIVTEQKLVTNKCNNKENCVFVQTLAAAEAHHCRFCSSTGLTLEHGCAFDGGWGKGQL